MAKKKADDFDNQSTANVTRYPTYSKALDPFYNSELTPFAFFHLHQ